MHPPLILNLPSSIYREQIKDLTNHMWRLSTQDILHPMDNRSLFQKIQKAFDKAEGEAYLCCATMDKSSIASEIKVNNATDILQEMTHLKNNAHDLVKGRSKESDQ